MKLDTLLRAAQILRLQPSYAMPLARLHSCLAEELGGDAGTYGEVYRELKKRPQSFIVLDAPRLLTAGGYHELGDEALPAACARVSLTEFADDDPPTDALGLAAATVSELWQRTTTDSVLRDHVAGVAEELEAIIAQAEWAREAAPPTILPRGPHHEPRNPPARTRRASHRLRSGGCRRE